MQKQKVYIGLWKFHERVPEKDLLDTALELSQDKNYLNLYIRKVSKDQNAIGFTYDAKDREDNKQAFDDYQYETSEKLKRKFGNDLVGWDLSSSAIIIK